ncbi:hypothetical protein [Paenisporosarcina sp. NPDC076898]|uniref:hypothetical protein n=1 Tax=unclassified Paenisporosarcina TaxID=2642018 RepID=UPI003D000BA5
MANQQMRLLEAKQVLEKMANGVHPLTDQPLDEHHFLQDPRVIRPLFLLLNHLNEPNSNHKKSPKKYIITQKQLDAVEFPNHRIGINDFCSRVNEQLDLTVSKKLSGKILNDKLKKLGILSEETTDEGKKRSVTNDTSASYGISTIERSYNGSPYQQIVFDDMGREFLLRNLHNLLEG